MKHVPRQKATRQLFDVSRPTNTVEAAAQFAGVSRGLAYSLARTGEWPSIRAGNRLLVLTRPFLDLLGWPVEGGGGHDAAA